MIHQHKKSVFNLFIITISILIIIEFITGLLTWENHWWVLVAWFIPITGGISIYHHKKNVTLPESDIDNS